MAKDKDLVRRLENFRELAWHVREIALRGSPRDSDAAAVERIASLIGKSRINTSMFGRYLTGQQKAEVQPKTYLSFAEFLLKVEPKQWGPTLDDALAHVYDWIEYGPDGAPPDASEHRHWGRPGVAQIQAGNSPQTQRLSQDAPDMTVPEILDSLETLVVALRYRVQEMDECVVPVVTPPEPPCNDRHPLASLLYIGLHRSRPTTESERKEAIADLSAKTGLSMERARAILCGGTPDDSEIEALARLVSMDAADLAPLIGRFQSAALPAQNGKAVA